MDMASMAWNCLFRNLEEWTPKYGTGYIRRVPIQDVSQFEGFASGIFHFVGTIVECYDFYLDFLFESELWVVEEVL
jgi:hypothetical protein